MTISFGVDIGGTKISAGYFVDGVLISNSRKPYQHESVVDDIVSLYRELTGNRAEPERIGISCAGLVDPTSGTVVFAGNLKLENFPLANLVSAALKHPVRLENDARCALWGEFIEADGQFGRNVAGLALGTGVGGGLVINSSLIQGKQGFSGELGHLPVRSSLFTCACGLVGCLETIAGGRSFESNFNALGGGLLTAHEILRLAREGDQAALEAFAVVGRAVGEVVAQLDTALDLDAVVISGGFGSTFNLWESHARTSYLKALVGGSKRIPLRFILGSLGEYAQLRGASSLV